MRKVPASFLAVASLILAATAVAQTPPVERIAYIDLDDKLRSVDLAGKDTVVLSEHAAAGYDAWAPTPVWAPDGKGVAFVARKPAGPARPDICRVDADGKNERVLATWPRGLVWALAWSPDGRSIAASGRSSQAILIDVASGKTTEVASDDTLPDFAGWCAWSPDSKRFLFADAGPPKKTEPKPGEPGPFFVRPSGVAVHDLATGKTDRFLSPAGEHWIEPDSSPDASKVAFIRTNQLLPNAKATRRELCFVDLASGSVTTIGEVKDGARSWTPPGDGMVYLDASGRVVLRVIAKGDDRVLAELPEDTAKQVGKTNYTASSFSWSRDAKTLALAAGGSIFVIDTAAGKVARRISAAGYGLDTALWSADGKRLVASGRPVRPAVDPARGRNALPVPDPPSLVFFVFDAEGREQLRKGPCKAFALSPTGR